MSGLWRKYFQVHFCGFNVHFQLELLPCSIIFLYFNKLKNKLDGFYPHSFKLKLSKLQFPGGGLLWGADSCSTLRIVDLCICTGLSLDSYKSRQCISLTDYATSWKVCITNWNKKVIEFLCLFRVLCHWFLCPTEPGSTRAGATFAALFLISLLSHNPVNSVSAFLCMLRQCLNIPPGVPVSASISLLLLPTGAQPGVPCLSTPAFCHVCLTFCMLGGLCGLKQLSLRSVSPELLIWILHASISMMISLIP